MSLTENVTTLPQSRDGSYEFARFNALQHGVLSQHTVLPWEDGNEYRVLVEALTAEHVSSSHGKAAAYLDLDRSRMDNASAALRCRLGRGSCDASPSCRRRNPPCRPCRPFFCRFDRLTVENRSRWAGLASHTFTQGHVQLGPDRLPDPITLKLAKDVVDRRARRKAVARQVAPGAAGAQQIEDRVHRRPHVGLARASAGSGRRDHRLQPRPFRIT